jgi:hypothetical protein
MAADVSLASMEFFVPFPEQVFFDKTFKIISADATAPVTTMVSVVISTNGTLVYWDHWEDGYENPLSTSFQSTTEIWGDGNAANGCAPPLKGNLCTNAADKLYAGQAIVIQNDVPLPRVTSKIVYDGGDNIKSSYPVTVNRAAFPSYPGSLMAGAVEVYDTNYGWGYDFVAPLGSDTNLPTNAFEYVSMYCQAKEDNTTVKFNGGTITKTLKKGETVIFDNILVNNKVSSDKLIQAFLLTGDKSSTYELRWYALLPRNMFSTSFVSPVGNTKGGVEMCMFNPNAVAITATYKWMVAGVMQSTSVSIPPYTNRFSAIIPSGTGSFIDSTGGDMVVLAVIDVVDTGQIYDWGFPVQPTANLSPQVVIGLGFGCTNNACETGGLARSVIWITPVQDADLYIDYNNDGTVDETRLNVKAMTNSLISDPKDKDMSGAFIHATKPGTGALGAPGTFPSCRCRNLSQAFADDLLIPFFLLNSQHCRRLGTEPRQLRPQ